MTQAQQADEINSATIARWLSLFVRPDDVTELRALRVSTRNYTRSHTEAGFFDGRHLNVMAEEAMRLTHQSGGVYLTINPLKPEILARCSNRIKTAETGDLASDVHVSRRRFFYIDVDPVRLAGIGATDDEKAAALAVAESLRAHLDSLGWPVPILADSGNGWHLFYAVDLPADDGGLVSRCLAALAAQFDTPEAKVDKSVHNAARIAKIPGTIARKGDATPDRPHRRGCVVDIPDEIRVVPIELLEALGGKAEEPATPTSSSGGFKQTATSHGHSYGQAALRNQCDRVRAAKTGELHHTLASAACSVGRLVPAYLSFEMAEAALYEATQQAGGQDMANAMKTIQGQLRVGMESPATPKDRFSFGTNGHTHANGNGYHQASAPAPANPSPKLCPLNFRDLVETYRVMREPVIDGMLRVGEIMNLIAPPKYGKSWLVLALIITVAMGRDWFGHPTRAGRVLLVDNELHPETSASRFRRVAEALGVSADDIADRIDVLPLRGTLQDINKLGIFFRSVEPGYYQLVVLDAFYRTLPADADENSNGDITGVYNLLDAYADVMQCAFILIHHASKGQQNQKATTDVGSGAGSQSRAADTHIILRPHEEENVVVLDGVVRSFPPIAPKCLRWSFPFFTLAEGLDPSNLAQTAKRTAKPKADLSEFDRQRAEKATAQDKSDDADLLNAMDNVDKKRQGYGYTQLRALAKLTPARMIRTVARLTTEGIIEELPEFAVEGGNGARIKCKGLRRRDITNTRQTPVEPMFDDS